MIWELVCLCGLVDDGIGFSFGGVDSILDTLSMICELFCFCGLVDDGVGCAGGTAFDIDFTWSMALDSQSDKVRFDEVFPPNEKPTATSTNPQRTPKSPKKPTPPSQPLRRKANS